MFPLRPKLTQGRRRFKIFSPQHQRIFDRTRVVLPPTTCHRKSKTLVQTPCRLVGSPHFECRASRAEAHALSKYVGEQQRCHALPAECGKYGQIVDMQFVHYPPERTKSSRTAELVARKVDKRHALGPELRGVHVEWPGIGERRFFNLEHRIQVGWCRDEFDGPDRHARPRRARSVIASHLSVGTTHVEWLNRGGIDGAARAAPRNGEPADRSRNRLSLPHRADSFYRPRIYCGAVTNPYSRAPVHVQPSGKRRFRSRRDRALELLEPLLRVQVRAAHAIERAEHFAPIRVHPDGNHIASG